MRGDSRPQQPQPSESGDGGLIIVARDQPDLWRYLLKQFAGRKEVRVLQDRRQWERRQRRQMWEPERRRADRRMPLTISTDLRRRSFLIVPRRQKPHESRLSETT
jgi:hypothetical protein